MQTRRALAPTLVLCAATLALVGFEALRVYWIMPFPGSQEHDRVAWAHGLHRVAWWIRIPLWTMLVGSAIATWRAGRMRGRVLAALSVVACALVTWQANGSMSADVIFRQPKTLGFAKYSDTSLPADALVLGIVANGQARAYPIRYIGYHHQIRDIVGGQPVMVTYCTACRTGRVFRPVVDGEPDDFRLVGMDRWNAMFEDSRTKSWWRQANGEAVAGPKKGARLEEIPCEQASWGAWSALHPGSDVMEPDPEFASSFERMPAYEKGTNESRLTGRDETSWGEKSWVVGVRVGDAARAFDWNELATSRAIADGVGELPVALVLETDGVTFRAFDARWPGGVATLHVARDPSQFIDAATGTTFSADGVALDGAHAGARLTRLDAYQEFWHSWRTFQPGTTRRSTESP